MKRSLILILTVAAVLMMAAGPAMGGAFRIPEAGTPAMGQANAFVGQADDPSAVHHNAAGMVNLDGTQVMVGMNLISPRSSFTSDFAPVAGESGDAKEDDFLVGLIYQ